MNRKALLTFLVGLAVCVGGVAVASDLPNLPKDSALPKSDRSPGQVMFRHGTHVSPKAPDCTGCHTPKMWPMKKGARKPELSHKVMKRGELCGGCHEGERAFGLDECDRCHATE